MANLKFNIVKCFLVSVFFFLSGNILAEEEVKLMKAEGFRKHIEIRSINEFDLPKGYHEGIHFDGENLWVSNGEKINTWIVDSRSGEIIKEIEPAGRFTESIVRAGDGSFWVSDWEDKKLYRVKIENNIMIVEQEVNLDPVRPAGMVSDGKHLYVILWDRGMGTKYFLLKMDNAGKVLNKIKINDIPEPSQITWDGTNFWITSWFDNYVYKIDLAVHKMLGAFKSPVSKTTGIAWDGKSFWITGTHANLFQVEIISGK